LFDCGASFFDALKVPEDVKTSSVDFRETLAFWRLAVTTTEICSRYMVLDQH
jgi:hypothetical protein